MKRCACLLETKDINGIKVEEWRIIDNPSIGDIRSLRRKGAIILRQVIHNYGLEIHKDWVSDYGAVVVSRIDFIGVRKWLCKE